MYGNKAKNLESLQKNGHNVPEFYVIDSKTLKKLNDPDVAKLVVNNFENWRTKNGSGAVAVRSSAEGEDGRDKSFAGQYKSIMDVRTGDGLLEALKIVAASQAASEYSDNQNISVHAIVQKYVEPDIAGVLFTINPSNGSADIVINANPGHGSSVVDGATVTSLHIDRHSGDIRFQQKQQPILSKKEIRKIEELGLTIEKNMGYPQDIEWGFSNNILYVFQTRPVTNINHLRVWDNANIGESFPGIVLPLTFSIARRGYELVYKSQGYEAGLNWYQLEANHRTFHDMVGLFAGRMYYNLASWYKFIGLFPNNGQNQKYLDEQLQTVGDAAYLPPVSYPFSYKVKFFARVARRAIFFEVERKRYWRNLENSYKKYENMPPGDEVFLLLDRYSFIEQMVVPQMGRSADNDFFVMIYHGILKSRLKSWLGEQDSQAVNFLSTLHDVISARQATLLSEIASFINSDAPAKNYLQRNDYEELDAYLLNSQAKKLITEYRQKFLHRFAEDQKIESKNPLLELSGFYSLVKTYQQLDDRKIAKRRKEALAAETERNRQILSQLGPVRRTMYKLLVRRLKHHLRIREHNRLLRGRAYAYLRQLFLELGPVFERQNIINDSDDIYYMDIEEIFRFTNGTGYSDDVKQLVKDRKQKYSGYKKSRAPSRFITTGLADKLPLLPASAEQKNDSKLSLPGTISSPGDAEGIVKVLSEPIIPNEPFEILVVSHTDPGWTPLIALAKGIIIEHGGILSHAAIVTRELGIPSIIGVDSATRRLKNGMRVKINSAKGTVDIL